MIQRSNQCPVCGGTIFYKEGDFVICANIKGCAGRWKVRRAEDKELPTYPELKDTYA